MFKIHLFKRIFFFSMSERVAVRTPQSVELRLADVTVKAFAKSRRPAVGNYQNKQVFVLFCFV